MMNLQGTAASSPGSIARELYRQGKRYRIAKGDLIVRNAALIFVALAIPALAADPIPTFSAEVAPILYKNCVSCHRPGEIAPMPLLTYEQTRPWAKSIREKVSLGEMPPWHATEARGVFSNDRRLADADRETLIRWASNGAPQGDPKDLPKAPVFKEGWSIGAPDAVFTMQKAYDVPASGTIAYQYFDVPTNFTEDKWVQAIEVRPGARQVVHHVLVFSRGPDEKPQPGAFQMLFPKPQPRKTAADPAHTHPENQWPGVLIATTAPGTNAMRFEAGRAMRIPAGSTLRFQVHYTAAGSPVSDRSSVGMVFAANPPEQELFNSAFVNNQFKLAPGSPDIEVPAEIEFTRDLHITALFPHTHLRGKSWEYRMVYPDGHSEVVLSVPNYDFSWQTYYEFSKPLAAPKGARLEAVAHYDNSPNNPSNPDPKLDVRWGEQTWQEMQYSGITFTVDEKPADATAGGPAQPQQ
jgi:hypothetical protein